MSPKSGDIYLVKFHPSLGAGIKKYRPAVIISEIVTQLDSRFTLIAPLTTQGKKTNQFELKLKPNPSLNKSSYLLCWYLYTIDSRRLIKKLGTITPQELTAMHKILSKLIT